MQPAAVLSILVRTNGTGAAIGSLRAVDAQAGKSRGTLDKLSGVLRSQNGLWQDAAGGWRNASGSMATSAERAAAGVDKLNASTSRSRESLKAVSKPAGYAALAVAAIGAASVKTAADYESSMNTLKAVSGSTGSEMRKLSKLAVQLGADTKLPGTSAQDAAEAMTELIKAGVSVKDTMTGVRSTLVLSAAAGIDNAEAAKIAANAMNIFGLRGKDVKEVTDQLANTANSSSVEITDVADSMKMAGAVFNAFQTPVLGAKGAMTELNVAIGLLGNAGIRGSDAGTSLKQALLQLTAPSDKSKAAMQALYGAAQKAAGSEEALTAVMSGSKKERDAATAQLKKMNPELAKGGDIAYTASGKMRSLKDIMRLVAEGTKGMTQEQKNWYVSQIFGADATRSVSILMKAQGKQWDDMQGKVTKAGSAQALADAKMKGLKGSIEALKSSLQTLAIVFGSVLLPAITPVVKAFTSLLNVMDPKVLGVMIGTIGGVAAAVWLLNAALAANPIVLVVAGLALLGAALVTVYQKSETFRNVVGAIWNVLKVVSPQILAVRFAIAHMGEAIGLAITAFNALKGPAQSAANTISSAFGSAVETVRGVLTTLAPTARTALGVLLSVTRAIMAQIVNVFRTAWGVVKALFSGTFTALKGIVLGGGQILHGAIEIIGGILKGDFHQMWEGVKDIFRGAGTALAGIVKGFVTGIVGAVSAIGDGIWRAFTSAFSSAKSLVVGFVNDVIDVINKIPFIKKIGHVSVGSSGGSAGNVDLSQSTGRLARGGAFGATGGRGVVNRPMVMMGEEAPTHPEIVIPTNPAYRGRAKTLVGMAASAVGYAKGGVLDKVAGAAGSLVGKGAGAITKLLPGAGGLPPWLQGTGEYVLAKAGAFIKDKVKAAASAVLGGGGGGGAIRGGNIGGAKGWPTSPHGKVIGVPYQGTHTLGNWMSDNAIDIGVPMGSAILAVEPGTITRVGGSWGGGASRFDGLTAYLNNEVFYTHMKGRAVKAGQKVHTGDIIGESGAANGVPHLHIGFKPPLKPPGFAKGGVFGRGRGKVRALAAGGVTGNVKAVAQFLASKGFTPAQVAGIIGTMQGESGPGLSTTATNPRSGAYGIAQWLGGRKSALMSRKNPSSLQTQLQYLWSELQGSESAAYRRIKGAHSIPDAVVAWMDGFERGAPHERNIPGRTANAQAVFRGLANTRTATGGGGGGAAAGGGQTREQIQRRISANQDRIDRLRSQARNAPRGKKGAAQRTQIQDKVSSLLTQNRHLRETMRSTPATSGGPTILESQQAGLAVQAAELQRQVGGDITDPNTFANTAFARAGKGYDLANANKADKILKTQQQAIGKRIKQLRKALGTKGHSRAARTKWQQELAQLIPQHAELSRQRQAILHPQAPDTGGAAGDTGDPNQGLIDAINAQIEQERINTEAMKAHTDALNAVQAEVKRQTDFAAAVSTTEAFQIKKILVDTVAGGMGALVTQRAQTPGSGPVAQY